MGWIDPAEKTPPKGLLVLVEMSGQGVDDIGVSVMADHDFYLASWLHPVEADEAEWFIDTRCTFCNPTIHAWMPLPKHYQPKECSFEPSTELEMEEPMFENKPEWLYKGDAVYEQMTLEEVFGG